MASSLYGHARPVPNCRSQKGLSHVQLTFIRRVMITSSYINTKCKSWEHLAALSARSQGLVSRFVVDMRALQRWYQFFLKDLYLMHTNCTKRLCWGSSAKLVEKGCVLYLHWMLGLCWYFDFDNRCFQSPAIFWCPVWMYYRAPKTCHQDFVAKCPEWTLQPSGRCWTIFWSAFSDLWRVALTTKVRHNWIHGVVLEWSTIGQALTMN